MKFVTDDCRDGRLEVYLPSRPADHPFMSVCGHNVSAIKELPLLTSKDVQASGREESSSQRRGRRYVRVRFVGDAYPHKAQFKIAWTELNHLPRNTDGTLRTARRTAAATPEQPDDGCAFRCPADKHVCLPDRSVCNGVVDCPGAGDESPGLCRGRLAATSATGPRATSTVALFAAASAAAIVFGAAVFAANAYRRSSTSGSCHRAVTERSSDRIYSTVNMNFCFVLFTLVYIAHSVS